MKSTRITGGLARCAALQYATAGATVTIAFLHGGVRAVTASDGKR